MATFITVSEGDARLLRRNREQVQGNRLRKVEGDEQVATGKAIEALLGDQQAQEQPNGRLEKRSKRDEPAASRQNADPKIGH